jgi:hypothetical protein
MIGPKTKVEFKPGLKIWFKCEKRPYTIMACDERFIICSKPFNPKKTFLYVIVDLKEEIRGADNYRCKFDYANIYECEEALKELNSGELEISHRNRIPLDLFKVTQPVKK